METSTTVLLIEDNPADARLIAEMLKDASATGEKFNLVWVAHLAAGLERLRSGDIGVVLLDLGLPESSGLDTVRHLLDQSSLAPTLMVYSGLSDESLAVQALAAGAQDYLIKGQVTAPMLARAIRYAMGRSQVERALRETSAQLEAARARAECANEAKSRFVATMSHDLRTPLNGILGFAQVLQWDSSLSEQQRHCVDTIRHSGEHLLTLINDILDMAKIESGKFELSLCNFDLHGFLRLLVDIIGIKAQQVPNLRLVSEVSADVPAVIRGDERRLRQVLLNLLDNAVKFTPSGQVALRVNMAAPGRLRFEVEDTGSPLSAEQIARLFKPFEQAGDAKQRSLGTGLGLVISQQFVRLMGGEILVEGREGRGNLFRFEIELPPRQREPADGRSAVAEATL